jgi:stress response protein YsnF
MPGTDDTFEEGTATTAAYGWEGRVLIGTHGERLGVIRALYAHAGSDIPSWAAVRTGLFGTKETLVPIAEAQPSGEHVQVELAKEDITGAPRIEPDDVLSVEQERELYRHYGMEYPSPRPEAAPSDAEGPPAGSEPAIGGHSTDDAMTRSEEEVDVGTARRERGRARLRKYVVTEEVRRTVPVQREEARIVREPITDENIDAAMAGPEISTGEHEVVLYEDVPVVEKRTVPKERVRLEKETRADEEQVIEHARKEQIEAEDELDR